MVTTPASKHQPAGPGRLQTILVFLVLTIGAMNLSWDARPCCLDIKHFTESLLITFQHFAEEEVMGRGHERKRARQCSILEIKMWSDALVLSKLIRVELNP